MAVLRSNANVSSDAARGNAALYAGLLADLHAKYDWALAGGGPKMISRHLARGKILVRDRIDLLIDPLTPFLELSPLAAWGLYENELPSAGIVTGIGTVKGVTCVIIANDATVKGGLIFQRDGPETHPRSGHRDREPPARDLSCRLWRREPAKP